MQDLADVLVSWLLERVGVPSRPPVDLGRLATRMAVEEVRDVPMAEDGRLELRDGRAIIYVRSDLSHGRRQFTIAHELGHRLLLHRQAAAIAYRRRLTGDGLERLCDDIAAAILLPRAWVEEEFSNSPKTLETLRRMSNKSSASLSASLVRLREVHRWPLSLLRFSYVACRWRLASPAGVPGDMHGKLRTTQDTHEVLTALGSTRDDVYAKLPLWVTEKTWAFLAEVSVHHRTAVALVDLTRPQVLNCDEHGGGLSTVRPTNGGIVVGGAKTAGQNYY
jgi:hypothetical protein